MKPTMVRVTTQHLAMGTACNSRRCPIALALLGALADQGVSVAWVSVDSYDADIGLTEKDDDGRYRRFRADLSDQGHSFIGEFDKPIDDIEGFDPSILAPFEMELTWRELK